MYIMLLELNDKSVILFSFGIIIVMTEEREPCLAME